MTDSTAKTSPPIRVKLLGKYHPGQDGEWWLPFFPNRKPEWGNCRFIFDRHCREYDWLVVYGEMPLVGDKLRPDWEEELACARQNTLFTTYEPSTIKIYGTGFLRQFGWVLTSQEPWVIRHPGAIFWQPAMIWYYAFSKPRSYYEVIASNVPLNKSGDISAMCSAKQQGNTLHRRRYEFVMELKERMPEMELFGRGIRPIADKADALDPYKYHLAIENFWGPHHWTEKLADPFLGACMPVYYGCPNAELYFPPESFLRVDINQVEEAAEIIHRAIRDRLYEKNLKAILEGRRRVLEEYGPIPQLVSLINERHQPDAPPPQPGDTISSRQLFRRKSPGNFVRFQWESARIALRHRLGRQPS
jgi:hypothetical protein